MISAIVLAAGQATRFGRCKQVQRLGDKTVLDHVLDNVRASKIEDVVVVLGAHADEIREKVRIAERIVTNDDFASGMSSSIQAGLRALPQDTEAALIVLGDQPFVTPHTIDLLIEEYRRSRRGVVIPTYQGFRGNPVLVDRSLFAEMLGIRGDIGCRAIFDEHPQSIVKVPVDDRGVLADIDTKEDFDTLVGGAPLEHSSVVLQHLRGRGVSEDALAQIMAPAEAAEAEQAATAVDPICRMTVGVADAKHVAEYDGRRFFFCCEHCQRTFERDPQRYADVA
jgi:molybdenum cofactor cytidylyltransferase